MAVKISIMNIQLLMLHFSLLSISGTNTVQTTLVQCTPVVCPILSCANPIRLEGECCDKCPNEGEFEPAIYDKNLFYFSYI